MTMSASLWNHGHERPNNNCSQGYGAQFFTLKQKWMNVLPKQQCFIPPPNNLLAADCLRAVFFFLAVREDC